MGGQHKNGATSGLRALRETVEHENRVRTDWVAAQKNLRWQRRRVSRGREKTVTREVGGGMEDVECLLLKSQYRTLFQGGEVSRVDAAEGQIRRWV